MYFFFFFLLEFSLKWKNILAKIGILDYHTSNWVPFLFGLMCSYIKTFVFNCNHETKNFVLVWFYMLSIEQPISFLLLVQAFCSINFIISNFRRLKEDVRSGLPAKWRKGVGVRDASWKVSVSFWLIFFSSFIVLVLFLYIF